MSFILDALKKSETDRQRSNAPGIAHIAESGKKKHSGRWLWIVAGLLIINAAVLAALMARSGNPPETPAVQIALPVPTAAPPEEAATRFSDIVADAKRSRPLSAESSPTSAADAAPTAAVAAPDPAVSDRPAAAASSVTDGLPSFDELRVTGVLQLPELHLDIHVFSAAPADRFVFVNMSKYKERATLDEGPLVREITVDGVVLEHGGHTFLLPRE